MAGGTARAAAHITEIEIETEMEEFMLIFVHYYSKTFKKRLINIKSVHKYI